jgi:4-hydroxy-tetrahydrodipicolinate synthase
MIRGSIVALATPFTEAGEIDFAALSSLVSFQLEAGTQALVIAGSTGEASTLRTGEFEALLDAVAEQISGRVPLIAGTGSPATDRTIANTRLAAAHGADAALVVTPYYNRPMQHGLLAHFRAVADQGGLPLILYNVPSRTALDMLPDTVQQLSAHEGIIGLKESVSQLDRWRALQQLCSDDFVLLSGDDQSCVQAMRNGASGVISVAANVVPGAFRRICQAAERRDWVTADAESARLEKLLELMTVETNPIPVKWAMHEMNLCSAHVRLPLTPLSENYREMLRDCMSALGILNRQTENRSLRRPA